MLHDIDGDTHIPIALGTAIAALNERLQLDLKTHILERILKFDLFVILAFDRIGIRIDNLALGADLLPQRPIIELAGISLTRGVIDILHVGKNGDSFHVPAVWAKKVVCSQRTTTIPYDTAHHGDHHRLRPSWQGSNIRALKKDTNSGCVKTTRTTNSGLAVTNNDILRRLRYTFDFSDNKMLEIFAHGGATVTRAALNDWLKKDDDPAFVDCRDVNLAMFLNGLIIEKRGAKEGGVPEPETRLNNNIIFRKLKIALDLKSDDVLAILKLADFRMSAHELSAFFRKPDHKHYRECQAQVLRNFLHGMQLKYRPSTDAPTN